MKKVVLYSLFGSLILSFTFCDKNKRFSQRLDGDRWKTASLKINDSVAGDLPELRFTECDIYKESCEGTWYSFGGHANFAWQFRENGKVFEISNQTDHGHQASDIDAARQCLRLTGIYEVITNKRKKLEIKSQKTLGFPGRTVTLILER